MTEKKMEQRSRPGNTHRHRPTWRGRCAIDALYFVYMAAVLAAFVFGDPTHDALLSPWLWVLLVIGILVATGLRWWYEDYS
jgi:hypothetical protein